MVDTALLTPFFVVDFFALMGKVLSQDTGQMCPSRTVFPGIVPE